MWTHPKAHSVLSNGQSWVHFGNGSCWSFSWHLRTYSRWWTEIFPIWPLDSSDLLSWLAPAFLPRKHALRLYSNGLQPELDPRRCCCRYKLACYASVRISAASTGRPRRQFWGTGWNYLFCAKQDTYEAHHQRVPLVEDCGAPWCHNFFTWPTNQNPKFHCCLRWIGNTIVPTNRASQLWEIVVVDWNRLSSITLEHGGSDAFSDWKQRGQIFDFKQQQEKWEDTAFLDGKKLQDIGDPSASIRPTVATMKETVHLPSVVSYTLRKQDRRQTQLEAYLARHQEHGVLSGPTSTLEMEYYLAPGYGRLLAKGPGGQKLTREARAGIFGHLTEIDAACCHPRLLRRHLQNLGLWNQDEYVMLNLFCENYKSWRLALASYMNVDVTIAKTELIRLFYAWMTSLGWKN